MISSPAKRLAAVVAVGALTVAACGSDDDTASSDTSSATATTEAAPETTETPATTEAAPETTEATATTEAPATTEAVSETTEATTDVAAGGSIGEVATAAGATFIPTYTQYAPGYDAALNGPGPVTALMPTDEAFIAFSTEYPDLTNTFRSDFDALDNILQYHVIDGEQLTTAMATGTDLITLQGEPITVEVGADGVVVLNGGQATIAQADLPADNGVVQMLDGILLPPSLAATAS